MLEQTQIREIDISENIIIDKERKLVSLYGEPVIFHCHHYNLFLQQTISDPPFINGIEILQDSSQEINFAQLKNAFKTHNANSVEEKFAIASALFKYQGFGIISFSGDASGGTAKLSSSHYAQGWTSKYASQIQRNKPIDHFAVGFAAAVFDVIFGDLGHFTAVEESCSAVTRTPGCTIQISKAPVPRKLEPSPGMGKVIDAPANLARGDTNVDYEAVNEALWGLQLAGDDDGLIRAFNVLLTHMPANYYNRIQYRFVEELRQVHPDLCNVGKELIRESGHVCVFYTFGNIMESVEWEAVVQPMIKNDTDWVHGGFAVASSLGWGRWDVLEVESDKSARVAIDGNYETNYHLATYDEVREGRCFFAQGAIPAIMNIVYNGKIQDKPELTEAFYERLFKQGNVFHAREINAREAGDPYCEFIADRS